MDTRAQKPTLSVGNQIYLYRLLSESIGCGRQTIMGKVEEALAADRMGAEDLGFESTRALLEALDAFVALTVFKGGRIYATVTAQPAWDEALAAPEKQAAPAGKSWKRKKADKSLKPVRPRRVKRAVEAAPEAEAPDRDGAAGAAGAADAGDAVKDAPGGAAGGSPTPTDAAPDKAAPAAEGPSQPRAAEAAATPSEPAGERGPARDEATGGAEPAARQADSPKVASPARDEGTAQADGAGSAADGEALSPQDAASPAEPAREPAAQPAISLTVVYDPENANAGVTTLESTPDAGGRAAASEAALPDTDTTEAASPDADATDVTSPEAETPESGSPARTEASPSPAGTDGAKPHAPRPPRAPRNRTDRAGARTGRSAADDADPRIRGDRGTAPAPSEPRPLPEGHPADLTRDVYCPGPVLHELALLLPLGADALGILDAYYRIAQLLGTLEAGRNRASFPLGYLRDGERLTATVRLRRKRGDAGAAWVVDAVEAPTDSTADGR